MSIKIKEYRVEKKKAKKSMSIDFSGFFAFFGVSGVDHSRKERLEREFEENYYGNRVTLVLSDNLPEGAYAFSGFPEYLNLRGWHSNGKNTVTSDISNNRLEELEAWWAGGGRQVEAVRVE